MSTRPATTIDTAFDAWQAQPNERHYEGTGPSDYAIRCMLCHLVGLLSAMERDGGLPTQAAREVVRAFEKHTTRQQATATKETTK